MYLSTALPPNMNAIRIICLRNIHVHIKNSSVQIKHYRIHYQEKFVRATGVPRRVGRSLRETRQRPPLSLPNRQ